MSDLSLDRKLNKFVGETNAVWNLQSGLSLAHVLPEMFRPIFEVLDAGEKVDELKQKLAEKTMLQFEEEIEKANQ